MSPEAQIVKSDSQIELVPVLTSVPEKDMVVIPIHLLRLRRDPVPDEIEDENEKIRLINQTALYLQSKIAEREENAALDQEFEEAFSWLEQALTPVRMSIFSKYSTNARVNHEDFLQVLRVAMVNELLPQYDQDKGNFTAYFKAAGWKRLQEHVYSSASQLSTSNKFGKVPEGQIKKRAVQATSYHQLASESRINSPAAEEFLPCSDEDILRTILARELIGEIAIMMEVELSWAERTALELKESGLSYKTISILMDITEKAVDNANYRARKKLSRIDLSLMEEF